VRSGADAAMALGAVDLSLPGLLPNVAAPTPGGITAGGSLAIAAGRDLTLGPAPVHAGRDLSLAAGRDLSLQTTAVSAGGDAQLLAGRDLSLQATGHTVGKRGANYDHTDTTRFATASVNAGGNLVLAAGRDLQSQGAQLDAGGLLAASAGRDLSLQAVSDVDSSVAHHAEGRTAVSEGHRDETLRGTSLSGGQGVILSAGHDLLATAAMVDGGKGAVALGAGHDVVLDAGQESHTTTRDTQRHHHGVLSSTDTTTHDASTDTLAIGTTLSGASVAIAAGHDLTMHGAQVLAEGDVGLSAGYDVLLGAAYDTHSEEHDRSTVKRGGGLGVLTGTSKGDLFTRTHTTQHDASTDSVAIGSLVSGDRVTIAAGHDLTTQASQVAGTHDVVLAAGHDLVLGTADSTHSEEHDLKVNTYGAQRSGLHGMFGVAKAKQTATETDVTPTGSLVGSTDGSVTLSAGQDVRITGSDVLSQTGTAIVGQNVTIEAAVGTVDGHQTQSLHTGGIMAGLAGGAATQAEQAWASGQAAGRASDKRLKALYAAQAAYGAYDAYQSGAGGVDGAKTGGAKGASQGSGAALRIGIGASSASAHSDTHDDIAYASHIQSAGNVTIAATNGDLNVIGSDIAGQNVALAASHDLNLLSQAEQHTQTDHSANARGELGISIGSTTGFYATADGGKGVTHGNGTTYANSHVTASDTLTLVAGNDANIIGAQARGNTVLADIGHDLTLASQQTTDDYANQYWQAGGTYVYGYGSEVHAAAGKVDSSYTSVTEVSGIGAGNGGYQIHVGGNTDLTGAVIASTADASKNLLDTGTLSYRDLENEASYSAIGGSVSMGKGAYSSGGSVSVPQYDNDHSTTKAGIAQGTTTVRDGNADLSGLDRNPNLDAKGLDPIFDAQKVAEQQELGQVAGYVGMRTAGTIAEHEKDKADADWAAAASGSDAEADAKARQAAWSDGGANKVLLHGLVGAVTAALGGGNALQGTLGAGAGELASQAMQNYLTENGITDPKERSALMELASATIGGIVGGGSGAATALDGEQYNRQLHDWEHRLAEQLAEKSDGKYTLAQIEDALRNSSYGNSDAPVVDFAMGDNVGKGGFYAYTPAGTPEIIMSWSAFSQAGGTLDPGASFTFPASQNPGLYGYQNDVLAVQTMPTLDRGAASFVADHMNDADIQSAYGTHFQSDYGTWHYAWLPEQKPLSPEQTGGYTPGQQGVRGNSMTFYDTMLGKVTTIGVTGVCATAGCVMNAGNWDMSDPRTQEYIKEVSQQQLKIQAAVGTVALTGGWGLLADEAIIPSWMAYSGAGATSASANAGAQYLATGTIRGPDVLVAGLTGTFGGWATRLPGWQAPFSMMAVNTLGASANTSIDNILYGENARASNAAVSAGVGTILGYRAAGYFEGGNVNPWIVNFVSSSVSEAGTRITDSARNQFRDVLIKIKDENKGNDSK
jgi:filamentous hemagglutinin